MGGHSVSTSERTCTQESEEDLLLYDNFSGVLIYLEDELGFG